MGRWCSAMTCRRGKTQKNSDFGSLGHHLWALTLSERYLWPISGDLSNLTATRKSRSSDFKSTDRCQLSDWNDGRLSKPKKGFQERQKAVLGAEKVALRAWLSPKVPLEQIKSVKKSVLNGQACANDPAARQFDDSNRGSEDPEKSGRNPSSRGFALESHELEAMHDGYQCSDAAV